MFRHAYFAIRQNWTRRSVPAWTAKNFEWRGGVASDRRIQPVKMMRSLQPAHPPELVLTRCRESPPTPFAGKLPQQADTASFAY